MLQLLWSLGNQPEEARETQISADTKGPAALHPCWFPSSPRLYGDPEGKRGSLAHCDVKIGMQTRAAHTGALLLFKWF